MSRSARGSARPSQPPVLIRADGPLNGSSPSRCCTVMLRVNGGAPSSKSVPAPRSASGGATSGIGSWTMPGRHAPENAASASAVGLPSCSIRADSELSERPCRSRRTLIWIGASAGADEVVDRQRARRARRIVDRRDQRTHQDRREVAAVRAAPGAPAVGDPGVRSARSCRRRRRALRRCRARAHCQPRTRRL